MPQLLEINQTGKREDLANFISVVDAKSTPLTSMIKKGSKPGNSIQEWQVDKFAAPSTDGVIDGADVDSFENAGENRELLNGRIQKLWRKPMVSDFAENVSVVAGQNQKEYAASVLKKTTELKRDIEATLCSANDSQAGTALVASKTRGLFSWISNSAQTDLPVPSAFRTPTGSINTTATASLTESDVQAVLTSIYDETGTMKRLQLLCGSTLKRRFTDFSQHTPNVSSNTIIRTFNQDAKSSTIYASVDMFVGDFGELELIPSSFLKMSGGTATKDVGLVLDMDLLELRFTRLPRHRELEDKGGGRRGIIDTILTMCVKNPLGLGKFQPA